MAILLALAATSCSRAVNYLSPTGPLHTIQRSDTLATPTTTGSLRVVSFNIAFAIEIDRAIEVLKGDERLRGADILSLQEMDAPGAERIARALGMNSVYYPSGIHTAHDRDFGCAILSPWPLVEPHKLILPHGARGSGLRRAVTSAVVVRGNERIRVYSLHLPAPASISGGSREDELQALAKEALSAVDPVVIAGDFNAYGKVEVLEKAGFDWTTRELGGTRPVRLFGIKIRNMRYDHILTRGLRRALEPDAMGAVTDNHGASDHLPIWMVLVPAGGDSLH